MFLLDADNTIFIYKMVRPVPAFSGRITCKYQGILYPQTTDWTAMVIVGKMYNTK